MASGSPLVTEEQVSPFQLVRCAFSLSSFFDFAVCVCCAHSIIEKHVPCYLYLEYCCVVHYTHMRICVLGQ